MQAFFRVDASKDMGAGHVMRCLALAQAFRSVGIRPHLVCRELPGHLADRIRAHGFEVTLLPLAKPYEAPTNIDDYSGWLQVGQAEDAEGFLRVLPELCDYVIVDHYALGETWERLVRGRCDKLIAIDDLCRVHSASFVIDQTLGRPTSAYAPGNVDCVLTGGPHALLQPVVYQLREQLDRSVVPETHRLLVSMGGADPLNVTGDVVEILAALQFDWIHRIDVVLPAAAPHHEAVEQRVVGLGEPFVFHDFVDDFAVLMSHCTLAIGAPGTTTWERAALGLPSVLVPLALNQAEVAASMARANAAVVVDGVSLAAALPESLATLRERWPDYVLANQLVCDGLGCRRVIQRVRPAKSRSGHDVWLEHARETDIHQVYEWQQTPETRRFARNPQPPSWEEHDQWMRARLASPDCYFYLLRRAGVAAGVVRLDRLRASEYEVSIFTAPRLHGQGLGGLALSLLSDLHREIAIHATVLPDNTASQRLFAAAGYQRVAATQFVLPPRA